MQLEDKARVGVADARRLFKHRVEHRSEIAGRGIDGLQHLGGRGLPLKRFALFVQEPDVLNCDHRLVGEILDKLNLPLSEWSHLLAVNVDHAKQRSAPA